MKWQLLIADQFNEIEQELALVLDGLTVDNLNRQPARDANSIGWLAWHLTRSLDRNMSELIGEKQLWISEKWYSRFNRESNPGETGYGHNTEQTRSFLSPDSAVLMEYHRAVLKRVQMYINNGLTEPDLDRKVHSPTLQNSATVISRLAGEVRHAFMHVGQAGYVRGILKGKGWYR
jgi:uncharacterized damage-inducible protein DinB